MKREVFQVFTAVHLVCTFDIIITCHCADFVSGWSPWSDWTSCSTSCGPGTRHRTRTCTGGTGCRGDSVFTGTCNHGDCPPQGEYVNEWINSSSASYGKEHCFCWQLRERFVLSPSYSLMLIESVIHSGVLSIVECVRHLHILWQTSHLAVQFDVYSDKLS